MHIINITNITQGGKYRNKKTVFEHLDTIDIHVPETDRFDPYFVVYDFEALQIPIEEELLGRTLHFEHVHATVSICSNVSAHTEPIHLRSNGDSQQHVNAFIIELLKVQTAREQLLTEKYQPFLDALEVKQAEIEKYFLQGMNEVEERVVEEEEEEIVEEEEEEEEEEAVENVQIGQNRKKKGAVSKRVSKRSFLDYEAELSGDDDSDGDDDDVGSDVEG